MFQKTHFLPTHRIDPRAWEFLDVCAAEGIDARLVGGCVRDALLTSFECESKAYGQYADLRTARCELIKTTRVELATSDIDIAIAASPPNVMAFCKRHRFKYIPTGLAHGTLTILFKGLVMEVTSLRADIDTFGRHATVTFGASFEEDAKRRDFTMNALYVDHQQTLYDAFGGTRDLRNGQVRFIGDPAARIAEDYLRLYRYFRFWGRFGKGTADISVLPTLDMVKNDLSQLSIERVQSELFKILMLPWPGVVLASMARYGLLDFVFRDGIDCAAGVRAIRRLVILERFSGHALCSMRRLCALTLGKSVSNIFKLSRAQMKKINALTKTMAGQYAVQSREQSAGKLSCEIALTHPEWWIDAMLLDDALSVKSPWLCRARAKSLVPPPLFPLTGADVVGLGVTGARVGEILMAVKRQWIERGFTLDRGMCLACLEAILKNGSAL